MTRLTLGTASTDITPQLGLSLGGWPAARRGTHIHRPLEVRVLRLACGDGLAVIVSLDLLGMSSALCARIRERIHNQLGIPPQSVMLACTHTHSSPVLPPWRAAEVPPPDEPYIELLSDRILRLVEQAGDSPTPVTVGYANTTCDLGVNRRLPWRDGLVDFPPRADPVGPVDNQVDVLRFDAEDGNARAILFSYGCHPTVGGPSEWIGPDFPGIAREALEEHFPDAMPVFLLGNCGDVRSNYTNSDGSFRWDTTTGLVEEAGLMLGSSTIDATRRARTAPVSSLGIGQAHLPVHTCDNELVENSEFLAFDIGPATIVSAPAECFCEIGLEVRDTWPDPIIFSSITNGFFGYVPTKHAYPYQGYEVSISWQSFGLSAPVRDDTHGTFADGMLVAVRSATAPEANEKGIH